MTEAQAAAVAALLARYTQARESNHRGLLQSIVRLWWEFVLRAGIPGRLSPQDARRTAAAVRGRPPAAFNLDVLYDDEAVADLATNMAEASRASQVQAGGLSAQFQRQLLSALGESAGTRRPPPLPDNLRGLDDASIPWQRPAARVRYLRSIGTPDADAVDAALERAQVIAGDDLLLAERRAARDTIAESDPAQGYRRVIRPELSEFRSCGLCIAASDRVYSLAELLPIHARCKCVVMPILTGSDPGLRLNTGDLQRLYEAAGGTEAAKLKRVRVQVYEHGELGPVLRRQGDHFRDPDEVARDARAA